MFTGRAFRAPVAELAPVESLDDRPELLPAIAPVGRRICTRTGPCLDGRLKRCQGNETGTQLVSRLKEVHPADRSVQDMVHLPRRCFSRCSWHGQENSPESRDRCQY